MKKIIALTLTLGAVVIYSSCTKQKEIGNDPASSPAQSENNVSNAAPPPPAPAACATKYLDLAIDPATGRGLLYRIVNSPSNAPVTITAINGSAGNNIIGSSLPATTVLKMTGLSYDPATGICYGITGNGGSHPNSLIRFNIADPNVVGITPLISGGGAIDLSDIERNPATGRYYAINRAVAANNRIVIVDVFTANVFFLPLTTGLPLRGLAVDPGGKLYLMRMTGTSGNVYVADPATGGIILGPCPYGVVIAPGFIGAGAEMGLHFDDVCTNLLITGNFNGTSFRLTDALPACLGGPVPASLPVAIRPTVDFARLN
jgi:hypothetical protein